MTKLNETDLAKFYDNMECANRITGNFCTDVAYQILKHTVDPLNVSEMILDSLVGFNR